MIQSKGDLQKYMAEDMKFFHEFDKREQVIRRLTKDSAYMTTKYLVYLRKEEYYFNARKNPFDTFMYLLFFRKKNILGNKLGFKIPRNCFGPGLTIAHHGEIIVNENAVIGANALLHGGNCIGNNGTPGNAPTIGDGLDLGIGAKIIGNVTLGDNVIVGANAVVTKSFEGNCTVVGLPAKKIKDNQ